ncbi:corticoliberin-1 [Pygocentrus nattereri]|uniref:corticoliberin-1 n=1 Tax=Pygocentrus nattereri TaxID=42514 RepID=UPI000814B13A|nr:corticoliberin-1 [Pygocentrus nattereri]
MKLHVLLAAGALLGGFLPRDECKAIDTSGGFSTLPELQPPVLPILMRVGEEYFIRLDGPQRSARLSPQSSSPRASAGKRALQLQLTRGLLRGRVAEVGKALTDSATERERRSDEAPISLDLTFHLLREVLQMARAERLAQQANNNRKIMDIFGK